MKLISFSRFSYVISLSLHLSVLLAFVYFTYEPRPRIRTFQTSVFFEPSIIDKRADMPPQMISTKKAPTDATLSKKLDLVPGIKRRRTFDPQPNSLQTPSLKKYITPPKSIPFRAEEPVGFLKSNKRTQKPILPIIPTTEQPDNPKQPSQSSRVQSDAEDSGSKTQGIDSRKPFVSEPSFQDTDSSKSTYSSIGVSSIWQKKSDLMVYRNSLEKLITANWIVPPTSVKDFQILIATHIGPRGNLISINFIKRSGLAILDAAAERAIRVSTPFPEFPDSFDQNLETYRAVFRFTPDKVGN